MMLVRPTSALPLAVAAFLLGALPAFAQTQNQPAARDPAPVAAPLPEQIDLNLINLPTTMSIVRHKGYFRLTHRFAADLRRGSFSELAADLFTIDKGAIIGLEYRFAITGNLQAGVHRSLLSKTIQTFGRWDFLRQSESRPVSISLTGSFEGLNNLRERHQTGVAVTVSRTFGDRLALYATPAFVAGTHAVDFIAGHEDHDDTGLEEDEHSTHDDTWFAGIGGRLRFSRTGYITGEYTPRLHGYDPNRGEWGVGIEKRTGGHTLQLNITNSFGTTLGQLARGGSPHDIYLGFNITRRF
jgi:uncharacterized beta barrel domain-containing protein DUF5777